MYTASSTVTNLCATSAATTAAFDREITHFDLANNYGPTPGSAEKNLGLIHKEHLTLTGMSWLSAPKLATICGMALFV